VSHFGYTTFDLWSIQPSPNLFAIMYRILLLFVISLQSTLTSGSYPAKPRKENRSFNQWELGDLHIQRWNKSATALVPLAVTFNIYRSYFVECGENSKSGLYYILTGKKCNNWIIPDTPVECLQGISIDGKSMSTQDPNSKSGWFTCDKFLRVPEADQEIVQERQKWLKWRIIDFQEQKPKTMEEKTQFVSARLEVVNGVPVKS
jgi:hypothetical protein